MTFIIYYCIICYLIAILGITIDSIDTYICLKAINVNYKYKWWKNIYWGKAAIAPITVPILIYTDIIKPKL